jgi:hypothetical protein
VKIVSGQRVEVVLAPTTPVVAPTTAKIVIATRPVGATLLLDGKPFATAPWSGSMLAGAYQLRAHVDGYIDHAQELVVVAGQDREVAIDLKVLPLPPPPKPIYKQWWLWTGAAVAGAAVTGYVIYLRQAPDDNYDSVIHYP